MISLLIYPFFFKLFFKSIEAKDSASGKNGKDDQTGQSVENALLNYFDHYFDSETSGIFLSKISDSNQLDSLLADQNPEKIDQLKEMIPELSGFMNTGIKNIFNKTFY